MAASWSQARRLEARLVAPGRRGYWWVKWVTAVEPSSVPAWLQSPFPLT
jgi:DMSO/TMAO reductase YedYZ molybdopterin-dependent catalytic subunit